MNNQNLLKALCVCSLVLGLYAGFIERVLAEQLRVSIPKMPVHAVSEEKGVLVDFAKVLAEKLGQTIDIQLVPFSRSIYYVSTNKVDFHLPFIKPHSTLSITEIAENIGDQVIDNNENANIFNIIYSDATIFHVNFVLYSHKDMVVDKNKLANYQIETDSAHLPFFRDLKMGSDCIFCSLKKVQYKMTDGYIFADSSTDPLLIKNKKILPSIKRELYQRFEVKVVFPNTEKGQQLNKRMSTIITQMRLSGELKELLSSVDFNYEDWQLTSL
jgi:hypothetical protein